MTTRAWLIRSLYGLVVVCAVAAATGIGLLLHSKDLIFESALRTTPTTPETMDEEPTPFPVGVDTVTQRIIEDPFVSEFYQDTFAHSDTSRNNWWNQVAAVLMNRDWYQNLASPVSRIIVVWPGERKEELTQNIGGVLRWDRAEREEFQRLMTSREPVMSEGKFLPGQYVTHRYATPADVADLLHGSFEREVMQRYTAEVDARVPFNEAIIIASLIEREASDFENMREVSGVIWNRLFIDMPLQLDASLQYVRGSDPYVTSWWPAVRPQDKFLDSAYNTYEHNGLPPGPIANPSPEAILAALNPVVTECLYYFHTENGGYHCSVTYEEHVAKLKSIYGRGR